MIIRYAMIKTFHLKKSWFREKIITLTKKAIGFSLLNTISKEDTVAIADASIALMAITKEKLYIRK